VAAEVAAAEAAAAEAVVAEVVAAEAAASVGVASVAAVAAAVVCRGDLAASAKAFSSGVYLASRAENASKQKRQLSSDSVGTELG
jgi:hypothetical protein